MEIKKGFGLKAFLLSLIVLSGMSALSWKIYIEKAFTMETFVTNNRQSGPPRVIIEDGPLVLGEESDGGSPLVQLDWLSHRNFRDYRTVFIYKDHALGDPVCPPFDLPEPPGGYNDRGGKSYTEDTFKCFSLDRWTGGLLSTRLPKCNLKPGEYVVVTEYRIPIMWGLFYTVFELTSNIFTITEVKPNG